MTSEIQPSVSGSRGCACGKLGHAKQFCKFRNKTWHVCKKVRHLKAVCRNAGNYKMIPKVATVSMVRTDDNFFTLNGYQVNMNMIFDTGTDVSLVNEKSQKIKLINTKLIKNTNTVRTFNDDVVDILGQAEVTVESIGVTKVLKVLVVEGKLRVFVV